MTKHRPAVGRALTLLNNEPGWEWGAALGAAWTIGLAALTKFYKAHGHCKIPVHYKTRSGYKLWQWVNYARARAAKGQLSASCLASLEQFPLRKWEQRSTCLTRSLHSMVNDRIDKLRAYMDTHAGQPPSKQVICADGFKLGVWVQRVRTAFKRGRVSAEDAAQFEAINGWTWSRAVIRAQPILQDIVDKITRNPTGWTKRGVLNKAEQIYLTLRRGEYRRGVLDETKYAPLIQLPGWSWLTPLDQAWMVRYHEVKAHAVEHELGHSYCDKKLDLWVAGQRCAYRANRLPKWRLDLLLQIPRWSFDAVKSRPISCGLPAPSRVFYAVADRLRIQLTTVPLALITNEAYPELRKFIAEIDRLKSHEQLHPDKVAYLAAIPGWIWRTAAHRASADWVRAYERLKQRLSQVSLIDIKRRGSFGIDYTFIQGQRRLRRAGTLDESQIRLLETLPGWCWSVGACAYA